MSIRELPVQQSLVVAAELILKLKLLLEQVVRVHKVYDFQLQVALVLEVVFDLLLREFQVLLYCDELALEVSTVAQQLLEGLLQLVELGRLCRVDDQHLLVVNDWLFFDFLYSLGLGQIRYQEWLLPNLHHHRLLNRSFRLLHWR